MLGVARDADPDSIKASYRRQAKAHHPDNGGDPDKFAAATLAYDVLMDAKRRKLFDEQGVIDDSPVDAKRQQAKQVIFEMLAHALMGDADPLSIDLARQIEISLNKQIAEIDQKESSLKRALDRAVAMEKRFKKKAKRKKDADPDEKSNVFVDMLKRHQQQITEAMAWNKNQKAIKQIALEIIQGYDFQMNGASGFRIMYQTFGGSGTSNTWG